LNPKKQRGTDEQCQTEYQLRHYSISRVTLPSVQT
jgi:hypothetical protein